MMMISTPEDRNCGRIRVELLQPFFSVLQVEHHKQDDLGAAMIPECFRFSGIGPVSKIRRDQPRVIVDDRRQRAGSLAARKRAQVIDQVPAFLFAQALTEARHGRRLLDAVTQPPKKIAGGVRIGMWRGEIRGFRI